ncbi:MAG: hypothetical protein RLZZ609_1027 [Cyanobacteriota bacterium]|jgi:hypothetical protein
MATTIRPMARTGGMGSTPTINAPINGRSTLWANVPTHPQHHARQSQGQRHRRQKVALHRSVRGMRKAKFG